MTKINERKTRLVIETSDTVREHGRYREVIVEAHPLHATVRLKGMRTAYTIDWASVWSMAVKAEAERVRREKKAGKK